jgi:hypothetical protein
LIVVLATGIVVFLALYLIDARRQRRRPSRWS